MQLLAEYGRLELFGETEVLTDTPRASSVHSVRDTELALVPAGLVTVVKQIYPQVLSHLMRTLSQRLLGQLGRTRPSTSFTTVALVPASPRVPLDGFAARLVETLRIYGPVQHLSSASLPESRAGHSLAAWLAAQEDSHDVVVYQADTSATPWTRLCMRQADCILVVALGDESPKPSPIEEHLESMPTRARRELILLHPTSTELPSGTAQWLNARSWCSGHHHIRYDMPPTDSEAPTPVPAPTPSPKRAQSEAASREVLLRSDFGRLARRLLGQSVGLVLGGGGARGLAHLGVLNALEECGVPVDMIGGTSIGSLVGALYAQERGLADTQLRPRMLYFTRLMTSVLHQLVDLTYPIIALFTGRAFNRTINDTVGPAQIEDLWIPYFCISTDISANQMRVHMTGGLWRCVRASMTLAGYLPPISDPTDGHLLMDGGYVNNLPVDVMRERMGASSIIAVDVEAKDLCDLESYGDHVSGTWVFLRRWNPFAASRLRVPHQAEINTRLAYIRNALQIQELLHRGGFVYVRPAIEPYGVLDWARFHEIEAVGHAAAVPVIVRALQDQLLATGPTAGQPSRRRRALLERDKPVAADMSWLLRGPRPSTPRDEVPPTPMSATPMSATASAFPLPMPLGFPPTS